ncbi:MAG: circularly permuted type 2 ATP-grasp protein [Acidimicrobiales bacterium]
MGALFEGYLSQHGAGPYDEMFTRSGAPRPHYLPLRRALDSLAPGEIEQRCATRDVMLQEQDITFSLSGEDRLFPLDLVPRLIPASEWQVIADGVSQRVRALEAFLADVYGRAEILGDGVVPKSRVVSSPGFLRQAAGIEPPNGVRLHVAGIDLVRDASGKFRVLEDNVRTPSGVSYVIENRRTMTRVLPELFGASSVRPVSDYPARLLESLRRSAPRGVKEPRVVVLTPGAYNSAYFEHVFLARKMGVELVEARDIKCRDGKVWLRTTSGEHRVDVVYRRVDDEYLDPLAFRPGSLLGCPGIVNANRQGGVTLANAVGNGLADDKSIYPYVPDMVRYYLGEEPVLANVGTYRPDDPEELEHVLANLDRLVIKPVDGSGGRGIVIGPQASDAELAQVRELLAAKPRAYIAQDVVALSTAPTLVDGHMAARHVDLRPFAVNDGESVWVMPGGLTRVALQEGSLVVNSSQGGGSKDTWVLTPSPVPAPAGARGRGESAGREPATADRPAAERVRRGGLVGC